MKKKTSRRLLKSSLSESGTESPYKKSSYTTEPLNSAEKRFLLLVERGDIASIKRLLEIHKDESDIFCINCVDPLGRSALIMAIENENYELIQLLLFHGVKVKDALLHAIKEEYVEAVELLLEWEEQHHTPGTPYSWEAADRDMATFTPDITPLILAAHKNNYEIIKILLDRGATLPLPHHVKCGCDICIRAAQEDSLRYSRSRINAYRALASPSLICLSSTDPFLTAFELSWELRRLAKAEAEFRAEYNDLRRQCQEFATTLLGHARTSVELQTLLNHRISKTDEEAEGWEPGEKQSLHRLKLAINYKQKKFVAHPSVQQLLASMWYEGLPGFRRKSLWAQFFQIFKLGIGFPFYSISYMIFPNSEHGKLMRKPFVKFITHSASYMLFLGLLAAASQRVEFVLLEWISDLIGSDRTRNLLQDWERKERGAIPGFVESAIIIYIFGWVWAEIKELYSVGFIEYIHDLWNVVDLITNSFYVSWFFLRASAVYIAMREMHSGLNPYLPREHWTTFDPMLISEGMFGAGMIFSFLKLVHVFSVNPHLGPLQISLGRMVIDILKFFCIYSLVLFAFGCGLNQLLWYYAELEKAKCYSLPGGLPDSESTGDSCFIWRRFANLFETSQSLFWASFGLVDLGAFELAGIKGFTRFWAMLMFGSYSVINIIVLLNMLIAMMSTSYQIISERSDTEWKFARSKLWISYFDEGATVPPPFNIIPSVKSLFSMVACKSSLERKSSINRRHAMARFMHVSRLVVRRYVSAEEARKQEEAGISEDDVNEIRQDISSFRFELVDILKLNGMRTPTMSVLEQLVAGRKGKVMERRLMKDFHIGVIEDAIKEAIVFNRGSAKDVFARIANAIGRHKKEPKDWNAVVRRLSRSDPIGSKQTSLKRRSLRLRKIEAENDALFSMDPERLAQYNPKLLDLTPATRVAYAKFKTKMLLSHVNDEHDEDSESLDGQPPEQQIARIEKPSSASALTARSVEQSQSVPVPESSEPLPSIVLESSAKFQVIEDQPTPSIQIAEPATPAEFQVIEMLTPVSIQGLEDELPIAVDAVQPQSSISVAQVQFSSGVQPPPEVVLTIPESDSDSEQNLSSVRSETPLASSDPVLSNLALISSSYDSAIGAEGDEGMESEEPETTNILPTDPDCLTSVEIDKPIIAHATDSDTAIKPGSGPILVEVKVERQESPESHSKLAPSPTRSTTEKTPSSPFKSPSKSSSTTGKSTVTGHTVSGWF